jgi:hypothetical protein
MRAVSLTVGAIVVVLLAGVAPAHGQWRAERRDDRRDDNRVNVEQIINQVESRSDAFRRSIDRALDRSRLNGSRQEDRLNEEVKQFARAVDRLRSEFDRRDSRDDARRNVDRVLREADEIGRAIGRANLARNVEREWAGLRADLNRLASVYNLKPLRA